MSDTRHTPTPWTYDKTTWDDAPEAAMRFINGDQFDEIAQLRGQNDWPAQDANAEFIVRACNCHDDLLAACEEVRKRLKRLNNSTYELDLVIAKAKPNGGTT